MRIRKRARLDPSQIQDRRGMAMPGGRGIAVGGGGIGIVVALVVLAFNLFGGDSGSSALQTLRDLSGLTVGTGETSSDLSQCQSGADAQNNEDCRIVAYVNSIQQYWGDQVSGYAEAPRCSSPTRRHWMRAGDHGDGTVLLPRRPEGLHRPRLLRGAHFSLRRPGGPLARPTCSHTSTATTSKISSASSGGPEAAAGSPKACRSGSNCRLTATPACGRPTPWTPATSRTSPTRTSPTR